MKVIQGTLVQQAHDEKEQRTYALAFKDSLLAPIKNNELKRDLEKIHPVLLYLLTHTPLDGWFALEGNHHDPDLDELYGLFYAPMQYARDKREEKHGEGFKVLYGKNLTRNGLFHDKNLVTFLDIFDKYIEKIPDRNFSDHLEQSHRVYDAFEPVLSHSLKERYQQSLKKLESIGLSRHEPVKRRFQSLEKLLGCLALGSLVLSFLFNQVISGNVILSQNFLKKLSFFTVFFLIFSLVSGFAFWQLRNKKFRIRKSFLRF